MIKNNSRCCFHAYRLLANSMSASAEEITDLFYKKVTYSGVEGGKIGENWKYLNLLAKSCR